MRCHESVETHVLEVQRVAVDSTGRWCDPVGELSWFNDAPDHERLNEFMVFRARQPFVFMFFPCLLGQNVAGEADEVTSEVADGAVKAFVWQGEAERNACFVYDTLPAADS